jgi:orotate phosphoribosyltransferase
MARWTSRHQRVGLASPSAPPLPDREHPSLTELRQAVVAIVKEHGLEHRPEPITLSSGVKSHWYMNGKRALAVGYHLSKACKAILELAHDADVEFDAVGGLTLGADAYATGIAIEGDKKWFVVRKKPKDHGTKQRIEGTHLGTGVRVLLVDDVVTTGASILEAYEQVKATGADVVLAVTLVDRGDEAAKRFADIGVPYKPLITYHDLGIPAVGDEQIAVAG